MKKVNKIQKSPELNQYKLEDLNQITLSVLNIGAITVNLKNEKNYDFEPHLQALAVGYIIFNSALYLSAIMLKKGGESLSFLNFKAPTETLLKSVDFLTQQFKDSKDPWNQLFVKIISTIPFTLAKNQEKNLEISLENLKFLEEILKSNPKELGSFQFDKFMTLDEDRVHFHIDETNHFCFYPFSLSSDTFYSFYRHFISLILIYHDFKNIIQEKDDEPYVYGYKIADIFKIDSKSILQDYYRELIIDSIDTRHAAIYSTKLVKEMNKNSIIYLRCAYLFMKIMLDAHHEFLESVEDTQLMIKLTPNEIKNFSKLHDVIHDKSVQMVVDKYFETLKVEKTLGKRPEDLYLSTNKRYVEEFLKTHSLEYIEYVERTVLPCFVCGDKKAKTFRCGNCLSNWYCTKECQKKDWKIHKEYCKAISEQIKSQKKGQHVHDENCNHDHDHKHDHKHEHNHVHGENCNHEHKYDHKHVHGENCKHDH